MCVLPWKICDSSHPRPTYKNQNQEIMKGEVSNRDKFAGIRIPEIGQATYTNHLWSKQQRLWKLEVCLAVLDLIGRRSWLVVQLTSNNHTKNLQFSHSKYDIEEIAQQGFEALREPSKSMRTEKNRPSSINLHVWFCVLCTSSPTVIHSLWIKAISALDIEFCSKCEGPLSLDLTQILASNILSMRLLLLL